TSRPSAKPRTKQVLPAPNSPTRPMISPPCNSLPSLFPQPLVWLGERVTTVHEPIRERAPYAQLTYFCEDFETRRLLKKTHMLRCAQSPRSNVLLKYASARRFFARLASEVFEQPANRVFSVAATRRALTRHACQPA